METSVFDNEILDKWLEDRNQEILESIKQQRKLTHKDMLVLSLKSQSSRISRLDEDIKDLKKDMDTRFAQVDKRFDQIDKRFDKLNNVLMWGFALFATVQMALVLKVAT